jgi:hypothetical protein
LFTMSTVYVDGLIVSSIQNPCSAFHKEANDRQLKNPKKFTLDH